MCNGSFYLPLRHRKDDIPGPAGDFDPNFQSKPIFDVKDLGRSDRSLRVSRKAQDTENITTRRPSFDPNLESKSSFDVSGIDRDLSLIDQPPDFRGQESSSTNPIMNKMAGSLDFELNSESTSAFNPSDLSFFDRLSFTTQPPEPDLSPKELTKTPRAKPNEEHKNGNEYHAYVLLVANIVRACRQARELIDSHVWGEVMKPSLNKYIMPTVKIYFSVIAANEDEKKLKQEFHTALEKIRKVPIVKGLDPLDYILKGVDDFIDHPSATELSNKELNWTQSLLSKRSGLPPARMQKMNKDVQQKRVKRWEARRGMLEVLLHLGPST